jgi:hypothetical protein
LTDANDPQHKVGVKRVLKKHKNRPWFQNWPVFLASVKKQDVKMAAIVVAVLDSKLCVSFNYDIFTINLNIEGALIIKVSRKISLSLFG